MTLIVAVTGPETVWMLADRRLSYGRWTPKDDGIKIMCLECPDGLALLGYAGLGATAKGTEPAEWMRAVLRGPNRRLETALGVLAGAAKRQIPKHLAQMPRGVVPVHNIIIPALLGAEPRLYSIDLQSTPNSRRMFRFTRHVNSNPPLTPRIGFGGSGALSLMNKMDKQWERELVRIVDAHDKSRVSASAVCDHLAALNDKVRRLVTDESVGPRCIVAWRYRKNGVHGGGGGHACYSGLSRERSTPPIPSVANGMDVNSILKAMMPFFEKNAEAWKAGKAPPELDKDEVNAALRRQPHAPDETLR